MNIKSVPFLLTLIATVGVASAQDQYSADDVAKMRALIKEQAASDPIYRADQDTLSAILARYESEPETLTFSEKELLRALFTDASLGTRNKNSDRLRPLLNRKGVASGDKAAIPALRAKPTFQSGLRTAPGGKKIGFVEMRLNGRRSTLVEVLSAAGGSQAQRARVIRDRIASAQTKDPLWWMKLSVGATQGETVVRYPRIAAGHVVTADRLFAEECGRDTRGLARMLIFKIRDGYEPKPAGLRSTPSPEQIRSEAVSHRQVGDDLYGTDVEGAAKSYALSTDPERGDPSYAVGYLRLADLRLAQGRKDEARTVLNRGIEEPILSDPDRAKLRAHLAKIK